MYIHTCISNIMKKYPKKNQIGSPSTTIITFNINYSIFDFAPLDLSMC